MKHHRVKPTYPYPTILHIETEVYTLLFQSGVLWGMRQMHCGIYKIDLLALAAFIYENPGVPLILTATEPVTLYDGFSPVCFKFYHNTLNHAPVSITRADWPKLHDMFKARDAKTWRR